MIAGGGAHPGAGHALVAHADWSVHPRKRWMARARREGSAWHVPAPEPVGDLPKFLARLTESAAGAPVVLGLDCPIGLPRAYAACHGGNGGFPDFLARLTERPGFFDVCATPEEIGPGRPFYPTRPAAGIRRAALVAALGLPDAASLYRACERATPDRPAGAPLFWTLGANQVGKAAIAAWRDLLLSALAGPSPPLLWPFDGPLRSLLVPGRIVVAETYPAEALRQLRLKLRGSKRRRSDRAALADGLFGAMARLGAAPDAEMVRAVADGFGEDAAGEDRFDATLGLLCILGVLAGQQPDTAPACDWVQRWEGWVLGQAAPAALIQPFPLPSIAFGA